MKRVLFIYNRHAGKNKTWAGLSNIINAMTEEDCLVTAYPTQYRGDAGEAIVRWNKDFDQVVVAGGDGTLSEAIAGAVRLDEQPIIGYIPVGTTNDFSKNLNLPLGDLTALAATAVTGVPHTHDLGLYGDRLLHPPESQEPSGLQRLCAGGGQESRLHQALPLKGGVR